MNLYFNNSNIDQFDGDSCDHTEESHPTVIQETLAGCVTSMESFGDKLRSSKRFPQPDHMAMLIEEGTCPICGMNTAEGFDVAFDDFGRVWGAKCPGCDFSA